ncbi:MAG: hypothetical protein M1815_002029 [Lichina confinis]|nr:MAG: hypothetical protein M1815_002029 [Lichina confinis]
MASAHQIAAATGPSKRNATAMVDGPPKFDLDTYIANYEGRTRYARLALIGSHSTYLALEASRAAVLEAKRGKDVKRYVQAVERLAALAPDDPEAEPDRSWVETTTKESEAAAERMEAELKRYKNNLIKESIRMGNEDLGLHYQGTGDLQRSFQSLHRMRDYCTSPKHLADMAMKVILVAIEDKNWMAVQSQVHKVRGHALKSDDDSKLQPRLHAALGLAQMCSGNYREAALSFLRVDSSLGTSFNEVLTANDVAVYGGLCALATMHRTELPQKVLDNASFRAHLELEPHVRRAISFFCGSKFSHCLAVLSAHRTDFMLDLHLRGQVGQLLGLIRSKSIIGSFVPYQSVSLASMAQAFVTTEPEMEDELVEMIRQGSLKARIDSQNGLLISQEFHPREQVQDEVLTMAKRYEQMARLRLMILNIASAGLEVKHGKASCQSSSHMQQSHMQHHRPPTGGGTGMEEG